MTIAEENFYSTLKNKRLAPLTFLRESSPNALVYQNFDRHLYLSRMPKNPHPRILRVSGWQPWLLWKRAFSFRWTTPYPYIFSLIYSAFLCVTCAKCSFFSTLWFKFFKIFTPSFAEIPRPIFTSIFYTRFLQFLLCPYGRCHFFHSHSHICLLFDSIPHFLIFTFFICKKKNNVKSVWYASAAIADSSI